jgi:ferredoxin
MYRINIASLPVLYNRLAEGMPLFLPMGTGEGVTNFTQWRGDEAAVDFNTLMTTLSPKQFFFNTVEDLYTVETTQITPAPVQETPFILFSVRACDEAAIRMLDLVFLSDPVDAYYQARRNGACIITMNCNTPGLNCFCSVLNLDCTAPKGDVRTWFADDFLYWLPLSVKGKALTGKVADILSPCEQLANKAKNPKTKKKPITDTIALSLFNSPIWDTAHFACIACGTCTFVCPTCYCYDIAYDNTHDSIHGDTTRCRRQWDTCLNPTFTQMAHGNPRPTKKERFRQRFMHKWVYFYQKFGTYGCVGCGRCIQSCPANIYMLDIAQHLTAEPTEEA